MAFSSGKLLLNAFSPPKSPLEGEGTLPACSVQHRRCGDTWSILTMAASRGGADLCISTPITLRPRTKSGSAKCLPVTEDEMKHHRLMSVNSSIPQHLCLPEGVNWWKTVTSSLTVSCLWHDISFQREPDLQFQGHRSASQVFF